MKKIFNIALFALLLTACSESVDLSGTWKFALDPDNVGMKEEWFKKELTDTISLPGSLQEQGFGYDVEVNTKWTGNVVDSSWFKDDQYETYRKAGSVKVPFWLNPDKHYVGVAWYQKEIEVPSGWEKHPIILNLERTHWQTTLYIDGKEYGSQNSLSTPHKYELKGLSAGKHLLSLRVDNNEIVPIGVNAHSISDHTQSNWNGVIGDISLTAEPDVYISSVAIYPDVVNKKIEIKTNIVNTLNEKTKSTITNDVILLGDKTKSAVTLSEDVELGQGVNVLTSVVDMGSDVQLWDEYTPNLYNLTTTINTDGNVSIKNEQFGMREIKANGRRFEINGKPIFLRGTLECCIFPLTGYPAMDKAYWTKIYHTVQNFGLNHVRFHSWCPPSVAFQVADSMGVYLQVECGGWANVGDGGAQDEWFMAESERIVKEYGNHPSFCLMAYGNEPGGANQREYLSRFASHWQAKDSRHLYTGGAGWPYIESADYYNNAAPRIQAWGGGLKSIINAEPPKTTYDFTDKIQSIPIPYVSHEIGQWCVYPNFNEIEKYTGVLKAKNFEIFKETLANKHMGDMSEKFLMASGKLQTLCYKADIEAALRTPEFAGFQLLDLHDFPGQGTALVGVLDAFWDTKGYVTDKEYSMFCNRTVPLARMEKLIWKGFETFKAGIEMSHFEQEPVKDAVVEWKITDKSGKIYKKGSMKRDLPINNCIKIGDVEFALNDIKEAIQLTLTVSVADGKAENNWNFWVYPDV
ncbi:MAG: beta-galactosidase, partial [Rikenellaceae bacterium]